MYDTYSQNTTVFSMSGIIGIQYIRYKYMFRPYVLAIFFLGGVLVNMNLLYY